MGTGFDWFATQHIWRMETHANRLYVSTMDSSTRLRILPFGGLLLGPNLGFDLYTSADGADYSQITRNGLGDKFSVGVRNMVSTPYGLFIGSQNHYYGLQLWRSSDIYTTFVPVVFGASQSVDQPTTTPVVSTVSRLNPAQGLHAEQVSENVVLSWLPSPGATRYAIYRADFVRQTDLEGKTIDGQTIDGQAWVPGPYRVLGRTTNDFYVDAVTLPGRYFHYYVVAETDQGVAAPPSNLLRVPSFAAPVTFDSLRERLSLVAQPAQMAPLFAQLDAGRASVGQGNLAKAELQLEQFEQRLNGLSATQPAWWIDDTRVQVDLLSRRLQLAQNGLIDPLTVLQAGE